jgi:chaperonin GroES|tara:strand:- start:45 stop:464 length:420 start_codon:yes stop_codon:yes gene_type:complete
MTKTLYVPQHIKEKMANPSKDIEANKKELDKLPKPVGWRILVLPFKAKEKTKGGVILTDKTVEDSQLSASVAMVLAVGDDAYQDKEKFPNGPWCKQGDWVVFGRYAGSRMKIDGGEVRLLNDDEILGTVDNPEDILTIL